MGSRPQLPSVNHDRFTSREAVPVCSPGSLCWPALPPRGLSSCVVVFVRVIWCAPRTTPNEFCPRDMCIRDLLTCHVKTKKARVHKTNITKLFVVCAVYILRSMYSEVYICADLLPASVAPTYAPNLGCIYGMTTQTRIHTTAGVCRLERIICIISCNSTNTPLLFRPCAYVRYTIQSRRGTFDICHKLVVALVAAGTLGNVWIRMPVTLSLLRQRYKNVEGDLHKADEPGDQIRVVPIEIQTAKKQENETCSYHTAVNFTAFSGLAFPPNWFGSFFMCCVISVPPECSHAGRGFLSEFVTLNALASVFWTLYTV